MTANNRRKPRPALDAASLDELALRYVGRFATTKAKLRSYLSRKLRERGWNGAGEPECERVVERLAGLGYVDDAAFALSKSRALTGRGYGAQRVRQSLQVAGVAEEDAGEAREHAERERVDAALRFAQRRRIGPFGTRVTERPEREKAIAAMIRAGHSFGIARAIAALEPGSAVDVEALADQK